MAERKNIRNSVERVIGPLPRNIELDHIRPLADGGRDQLGNIQPISKAAHKVKTRVENSVRAAVKRRRK